MDSDTGLEPKEALERVEHAEAAAEARERYGRRAAMLVAVLAAFLAVASLAGSRAATEAILDQQQASDAYNEYQANSLKRHVNENDAALLRLLAAGNARESEAVQRAAALDVAVATKYRPNQDQLLPKAQRLEHERELAEQRHKGYELAQGTFQLAIVLTSVAIVARTGFLLWVSGALGVTGLAVLVNTLFGLRELPL